MPEAKLHYFVVDWSADALSWEDFRGKVLGATDPATAEDGAIRKMILDKSPSERDILVASFVSRRARM